MADRARTVTMLLRAWCRGDQAAFGLLTPLVYDDLRRRARHYLRGERPNHTLTPTALVQEVYMRMVNIDQVDWHDRTHFLALAALQMRRILVDSARARRYQKRGGGVANVTFEEELAVSHRAADLVALDDALDVLALQDERKGARRRTAVLRRANERGNRRRAQDLDGHSDARLADGEVVLTARAEKGGAF
jgi:RNA polymerase sigma factor (TIGR02999 family)